MKKGEYSENKEILNPFLSTKSKKKQECFVKENNNKENGRRRSRTRRKTKK
jgi:hypothetical protein